MHRSRFAGFIIDCRTDDLMAAASFWSEALGLPLSGEDAGEGYIGLRTEGGHPHVEVQKVDHESRVHLDIETDDIEAEAKRLEALGAKRIAKIRTWLVMEAPTGQRFCLVRPQSESFAADANVWNEN